MRLRTLFAPLLILTLMTLSAGLAGAGSLFTDLDDTDIYGLAISGLTQGGAVQGYDDGTFKSDQSINRAEFLKIALAWYDHDVAALDLSGSNCYTDVTTEWFAPYVCAATDLGIVEGYGDGTYHPERSINFVEAAKIIVNTFDLDVADYDETAVWYQPYVNALSEQGLIAPTIVSFAQDVSRGEMAEMVYWSTSGSAGKWDTTYEDLQNGTLENYRIVYSSPGASSYYAYLVEGTTASYLGDVAVAAINSNNTRLAYVEYDVEDGVYNLLVKDLPSDETLYIFPELNMGETSGFEWSDDGSMIQWTSITHDNEDFDGVVTAYTLDLNTESVNSFETNSWYHCGSVCVPSPFVWSAGGDYGVILSFNYDENDDEYNYFLVYNSLGQTLYTSPALERLNDTPTSYAWNESEDAVTVTYSDGTSVTVEIELP